MNVQHHRILGVETYTVAVEEMNGNRGEGWEAVHEIYGRLRGFACGSLKFPVSSLGDVIRGGSKTKLERGLAL